MYNPFYTVWSTPTGTALAVRSMQLYTVLRRTRTLPLALHLTSLHSISGPFFYSTDQYLTSGSCRVVRVHRAGGRRGARVSRVHRVPVGARLPQHVPEARAPAATSRAPPPPLYGVCVCPSSSVHILQSANPIFVSTSLMSTPTR